MPSVRLRLNMGDLGTVDPPERGRAVVDGDMEL